MTNSFFLAMRVVISFFLLGLWLAATGHSLQKPIARHELVETRALNGTGCLTRLKKARAHFEHCRHQVCFIFVEDAMFTNVPSSMTEESDQRLFPCYRHRLEFPGLNGMIFDVLKETSRASYKCVFAGQSCSFNRLVDYIAIMAKEGYQFCIIGLMIETPGRVQNHRPGISLFGSRMMILGRSDEAVESSNPLWRLVRPFNLETWLSFCFAIVIFAIVALAFTILYSNGNATIMNWLVNFFGAPVPMEDSKKNVCKYCRGVDSSTCPSCDGTGKIPRTKYKRGVDLYTARSLQVFQRRGTDIVILIRKLDEDDPRASLITESFATAPAATEGIGETENYNTRGLPPYWVVMGLYKMALFWFFATFFLFYEAGVVQFLFRKTSPEFSKSLEDLSEEELKEFAVHIDTALEDAWHATIDPQGRLYKHGRYPWKRCEHPLKCTELLLDKSSGVKYMVSFDSQGQYLVNKFGILRNVTKYNTKENLFSFDGSFLYSKKVPLKERKELNKEILELRINNVIWRIAEKERGPEVEFNSDTTDVEWGTVLIPISIFVGTPVIMIIGLMLCSNMKKQSA